MRYVFKGNDIITVSRKTEKVSIEGESRVWKKKFRDKVCDGGLEGRMKVMKSGTN